MGKAGRPVFWHETIGMSDDEVRYVAEVDAELRRAQQVGEEAAADMIAYWAAIRVCPICRRQEGDHTLRELRRCDKTRPNLEIVR